MELFSELRYRARRLTRWFNAVLALLFFLLLAVCSVSGYLLDGILLPPRVPSGVTLGSLLGHPSAIDFFPPGEPSRQGWFFPGLKRGPTVILCHGYGSQRTDILTLATTLQERGYNVFLFDFSGHGTSPGWTTLGYRETAELLAAIDALTKRPDLDPTHFGVWGANLGGYVAVAAATATPSIRAFAADSVYDTPAEMLHIQVEHAGLGRLPLVEHFCGFGFDLMTHAFRNTPPLSQRLGRLAGVSKLFIESSENPILSHATLQLFLASPEPRQQQVMQKANYVEMTDEEKRTYEDAIVSFFLRALPPTMR